MSRAIKFRVWDELTGMREVDLLPLPQPNGKETRPLMQFTGLLDKNGKEIYEGDVIKPTDGTIKQVNRSVEFLDGSFCYSLAGHLLGKYSSLSKARARLFEVIGNIYEHPHLLSV